MIAAVAARNATPVVGPCVMQRIRARRDRVVDDDGNTSDEIDDGPALSRIAFVLDIAVVVDVIDDLMQLAEFEQEFERGPALIAIALGRLVAPRVVAEAGYCDDEADQRDRVADAWRSHGRSPVFADLVTQTRRLKVLFRPPHVSARATPRRETAATRARGRT